ncbi:MAG TPA: zf-HC2 domain-containing protein, partial [Mycobacteriales bacterium]|nr:zf-HC2 domain-containing protein [Mycobacteriales bacterium]
MTLPDLHLGEDALVAYVDGMLSPAADERAAKHLRSCAECQAMIDAEREAKALLGATPDPGLPAGLLARLLDVPMTADLGSPALGTPDRVLAVDGDSFGWSTGGSPFPHVVERRATAPAPARARAGVRPSGAARPAGRSVRSRRTRRGLAVSLAGLAFGVIASAATTTAPGSAAPSRPGEAPGTS